ncbi:hypothetical protein NVP1188A_14 [Vibrio phage 1.188.A._10N.286.51.A6]|uniref:Uncharacterized protein n=5 Tax=Mukerjeevirus TaxID=2733146 RepID=A0A2I7REI9_9CAUD|nr:hypothetical protein HOU76_gp80 [Vibrio phage 1.169.O._10N.261.52.B1]YP_009817473.1 hypothetical protein HOU77_gp14 [Vibrio phage 1.188.A._10N.286.51.A6]YP_009817615.1 hypothetical protein HOU79_gp15 [Vibrio phage 1.224.A._10N.261.48.B1]AUR93668.1 hypothetical protein NVP1188B_14 [Vibrio phage 1.188.B._10N.286.51.A6]AUR93754.1 hypothetical protein NVP1188C_14 [Vibrio phage 1.188.C._10N.286.51.A6]AUR92047.1 hypothetical protein NVP1169O_19 [Vibrio phage 1.169.O._10N.261.52.B1]AUR93582.1 hyp
MKLPINYDTSHWAVRKKARLQYIEEQEGKCQYCGKPLDGDPSNKVKNAKINTNLFPPSMFLHPIHLHHNHKTGMTIGAVHARCNAYLWQYKGE